MRHDLHHRAATNITALAANLTNMRARITARQRPVTIPCRTAPLSRVGL